MSEQTLADLLGRSADDVPDSQPPIDDLLHRGHAAQRRRRRTALVGAAFASLLVVGTLAASLQSSERAIPPADQSHGEGRSAVPAPPAGMKWVGVGRTVVAVPQSWPVVPGIYCQGPQGPYVTITQWQVTVGCVDVRSPDGGSPRERPSVDVQGNDAGAFTAQLAGTGGSSGLTQRSLDASRTTLPSGWLAVPAGEPYGGAGTPSVTSEIAALKAAGFHVVRRHGAPLDQWQPVTTDPEIGTPLRHGSTVAVYDHGAVASSATLTGRLQWVGGPAPGRPVPHPGTVHVVNADDSVDQTVGAGDDGRWEIYLPPGTYRVLATSPGYLSKAGDFDACSANRAVTLGADEAVTVDVFCQLR